MEIFIHNQTMPNSSYMNLCFQFWHSLSGFEPLLYKRLCPIQEHEKSKWMHTIGSTCHHHLDPSLEDFSPTK